jgi:23S rRNA pseudouridine2457 synthase
MTNLILFHKPFQVLSQFTDEGNRHTLKEFLPNHPGFYVAGRLDYDSEGLLLVTNDGHLQHQISDPANKMPKTYWVQVEGTITGEALQKLRAGVLLKDGKTRPAKAVAIETPHLPERIPPIRFRANIPTSWIALTICEGKNRQVRRMTASVGFPTLRLVRVAIGNWELGTLLPGEFTELSVPAAHPRIGRKKQ